MRRKLNTLAFIISIFVSLLSVYSMAGLVRTVDMVTLFFSGVGVGVTTIIFFRKNKDAKNQRL